MAGFVPKWFGSRHRFGGRLCFGYVFVALSFSFFFFFVGLLTLCLPRVGWVSFIGVLFSVKRFFFVIFFSGGRPFVLGSRVFGGT